MDCTETDKTDAIESPEAPLTSRGMRNGGHRGRGGKRPGAGRKPDYLKRLGITPMKAAEILADHDEPNLWSGLLNSKSEDVSQLEIGSAKRIYQHLSELEHSPRSPNIFQ